MDEASLGAKEAHQRALTWLARREYGRAELIDKLVQRGSEEELATRIGGGTCRRRTCVGRALVEALLHVRRVRGYGPPYIFYMWDCECAITGSYLLSRF